MGRRALVVVVAVVAVGACALPAAPEVASDAAPAACTVADAAAACGPPAGVAPDGCAPGFVFDGAGGCAPILPAAPCPFGQVAWLGETSCHDVSACGDAPWGDAPDEPTTQYVDSASTSTGPEDGTKDHPWRTLAAGIGAAAPGAVVALAAGSYAGMLETKSVRVWGRCARLVDITSGSGLSVFTLLPALGDTDPDRRVLGLHGVALHDATVGVTSDSFGVALDRVWIHDVGIAAQVAGASVVVTNTLVERCDQGLQSFSVAPLVVDHVALRDAWSAGPRATAGPAIADESTVVGNGRSAAFVRQVTVERWWQPTLELQGDAIIDGVFVQSTSIHGHDDAPVVALLPASAGAHEVVQRSVIARGQGTAIDVSGSTFTFASSVVSETRPREDGTGGVGLFAAAAAITNIAAEVVVRGVRLDGNATAGLVGDGADLDVDRLLVLGTRPDGAGDFGRGINLEGITSAPARIARSRIEGNREAGLVTTGVTVDLSDFVVAGTTPNDVRPAADGVVAQGGATLHLARGVVARNARAGVTTYSSPVDVADTVFADDGIDLDGESLPGAPFAFVDHGGNTCTRLGVAHPCIVLSSGLEPPAALP